MNLFRKRERLPEELLILEVDEQHRLAEQVFHRREAAGISQEKLAQNAQMTQSQIAIIEAGEANPTLRTMVKLAFALQVTARDLFSDFHPADTEFAGHTEVFSLSTQGRASSREEDVQPWSEREPLKVSVVSEGGDPASPANNLSEAAA